MVERSITSGGPRSAGLLLRLVLSSVFALAVFGALSASAVAYEFNEPSVKQIGPEEVVFDARDDETDPDCGMPNDPSNPDNAGIPLACLKAACTAEDIPDNPARAFRNAGNQIVLMASHYNTLRFVGPNFGALDHPCTQVMPTTGSTDPPAYNDKEWINALYTLDGTNVYGLIHEEYQGWRSGYAGFETCAGDFTANQKCWRNTITFTSSTDGGQTFTSPGTPVAVTPYQYTPGIGPYGYFNPSNIVLHTDGFYYAMMRTLGTDSTPAHADGTCIMRTRTLSNPASWRGWGDHNGDGVNSFDVQFMNPYPTAPTPAANYVCKPVDSDLATMSATLVYSQYLGKYMLVDRLAGSDINGPRTPGVWYSTSSNLLNWDTPKLLMEAEILPFTTADCVPPHPVRLPALIDHTSGARNYDTIGQRPYLYFTRSNMYENSGGDCSQTHNRDLVRIPIEFLKEGQTTPPPTGGGGTPPPAGGSGTPVDKTAATMALTSGKTQDVDKLVITVRLNEAAKVEATATVNVPGASKVYKFKRTLRSVTANRRVKLKLKLSSKSLKAVKRALKRGKKLTARAKVTATDGGNNKTVKRSSIRLKP